MSVFWSGFVLGMLLMCGCARIVYVPVVQPAYEIQDQAPPLNQAVATPHGVGYVHRMANGGIWYQPPGGQP